MTYAHDALALRQQAARQIAKHAQDGRLFVYIWSMDCDGCSRDAVEVIPATLTHWRALKDRELANAEGPVRFELLTAEQAADFTPETVDHALRAHEDGHPYVIHV